MATAERTREDWLRDRLSGIGGSEAAAALGESPFKTVWELWLEKTGEVEQPDLSDRLYVRLGQVMERGVGKPCGVLRLCVCRGRNRIVRGKSR